MAEQEKVTLHYRKFPCLEVTGTAIIENDDKSVESNAKKFYIVINRCNGTEGFLTKMRGFHNIKLKDDTGTLYKGDKEHEQFVLMEKDDEAIIIWYPDTEARGSSYSNAMKNAKEIWNRKNK